MTNDKVNEVLELYARALRSVGCGPASRYPKRRDLVPQPLARDDRSDAFVHLLWMCEEARATGPERIEKKMRWLGFVQGSLWALGIYSIDAMKNHNMQQEAST